MKAHASKICDTDKASNREIYVILMKLRVYHLDTWRYAGFIYIPEVRTQQPYMSFINFTSVAQQTKSKKGSDAYDRTGNK